MKRFLSLIVVCAGVGGLARAAQADIVYDGDVTPQVYIKPDSVNGWWTINRQDGIELALRAKETQSNTVNSSGDGTYTYFTGTQGTRALWDFEFAANTDYDGTSGITLNDVSIELYVDSDPTEIADLVNLSVEDWWFNNKPAGHATIVQNRDNLGNTFSFPQPFDYDLTQEGIYDFKLSVRDDDNPFVDLFATSMRVVTITPPPPLTGDYNEDGSVDAADYVLWRDSEINGQQGYADWRANFGRTSGIMSGGIPEPASFILFALAILLLPRVR